MSRLRARGRERACRSKRSPISSASRRRVTRNSLRSARPFVAADQAAGEARRRALGALERAEAEVEALAERERALVAREAAFAALEEALATRTTELEHRQAELERREEAAARWLTELSTAYRLVKAAE